MFGCGLVGTRGFTEAYLWHGTRDTLPDTVAFSATGVDPKFSRSTGNLLGCGSYFAESPLYSMHYGFVTGLPAASTAGMLRDRAGPGVSAWHAVGLKLLLCRVLVGKAFSVPPGGRESGLKKAPEGFDSVTTMTPLYGSSRIYAVYTAAQSQVLYCVSVVVYAPCCGTEACKFGDLHRSY